LKILLLGKNGQVGWELQRSLSVLGELVALDRHSTPCGDLSQPQRLQETVRALRPDVIVNAAAHTAVDKAESEVDLARILNAAAPAALAQAAAETGAWLVHYSTDYVFDGSKAEAYTEADQPAPLNVYGQTKLAGEQAVQASGARHLIFRTSWVYARRGTNFLRTMLRLASERDELRIVDDQHGAPTWARLIAGTTALAVARGAAAAGPAAGVYHLSCGNSTTWCGFARAIFAGRGGSQPRLVAISSDEYPTPARRPRNSRLDCGRLQRDLGLELPDWKAALALCQNDDAP